MTSGIVMLALGQPNYGCFALNLAVSIRKYSGDVPMQLIYEPKALSHIQGFEKKCFDVLTEIDPNDCYLNNKLAPGIAKLSLYKYLAFDNCLYLDVDAVCIKDVKPLLETKRKGYETEVQGWGELKDNDFGIKMQWAFGSTIAERYNLPLDTKIPFINSSAQFIKKGKFAESVYKKALANILDPIPIGELNKGWGKKLPHRQPDELYMNVAMMQLEHDPTCKDKLIYFKMRNEGAVLPLNKIQEDYYFLGVYGNKGTNKERIYKYYDSIMYNAMKEIGQNHVFKVHNLMTKKFMSYEPMLW